ncbi:alpha/beta hydrolase family protein [Nocardioides rubriscoriae]|uniref:alpha/beta hydrolase family protein n=1 Tax=Nocardioides rubriscoriae TaxID=642762 RepID=UPI001B874138|nr:alpha/beta fold hydrolase [Nocardioides rubriscoriae]
MDLRKTAVTLTALTALAAGLVAPAATVVAPAAAALPGVTTTNGCLSSVPEPGSTTPVKICYSIFKPAGASKRQSVPLIMHSHGWAGSRVTDPADLKEFLAAGYGVLSFDQRGFGESGGQAHVETPRLEGVDVRKLVDLVASLPWVQKDGPGDPRLGAIGGSYGGGYQFLGAFEELRLHGKPVFDALAPEITWNSLKGSLAPDNVARTEWAAALSAAAVPSDALPTPVYAALAEAAATGNWPDGSGPTGEDLDAFFLKNGPAWHVSQGRRLDIPVLFGQGTTDGLFPLQQGLANWRTAITAQARRKSIFVGYNGGHVLPQLLPQGINVTSDPCSRRLAGGDFRQLSIRFFDEQLRGRSTGLRGYGRLHLATPASRCLTVDSPDATRSVELGTVVSTSAAGVPLPYEIAAGPLEVAGTPYLTAAVTTAGLENRAFYGLAVGTSPADAHLVQNNVLPLREPGLVSGVRRRIALPSVAVDVPAGQHLYLLVSPVSDTFVGMGSRTPGVVSLDDTVVHLPVMR